MCIAAYEGNAWADCGWCDREDCGWHPINLKPIADKEKYKKIKKELAPKIEKSFDDDARRLGIF